jgi:hypothetical protein
MTVAADDGEVVPLVVRRIAVDAVLFNEMLLLMADAARVTVHRQEAIAQTAWDTFSVFQGKA